MSDVWELLGIDADAGRDAVRRAYARKLRLTNPEDDAEGFKTLRAAYEAALEHIAWVERWGGDDSDEGGDTVALDEQKFEALVEPEPRAPVFHSEPVAAAPPLDQGPEAGELSALVAEREAERAQLHAAMRALDTALRGVWRASDDELETLFNDVLAAPALAEIALQADVEAWAADLIAATIPRSDAILSQAVRHFGWSAETGRGYSYDVAACLQRIDEWRLIEQLGHHRNPLNPSWRSLTRSPGGWLFWRIDALRPGVASGVETLLGRREEVAPGLAFSFKPASVERWERLLARAHVTPAMLAAIPFAALLAFIFGASLNPDRQAVTPTTAGLWATLATVVLAPVLLFGLHAVRFAIERRQVPEWLRGGWIVAFIALGAFAPVLPSALWSVAVAGAAATLAWAWMTATVAPPSRIAFTALFKAQWIWLLLLGLVGSTGLLAVSVPHGVILFGLTILFVALRFGGWDAGLDLLEPAATPVWRPLALLVALFVPLGGVALVAGGQLPAYFWYYAVGAVTLAAQPVLAAALRQASLPRVRGALIFARVVLLSGLGAAWVVAFSALPHPKRDVPPVVVVSPTAPGTLRGEIVAALRERDVDAALATLADRQPGFGQFAKGNPLLYAVIRQALSDGIDGKKTPVASAQFVSALIAEAYHDGLARTTGSLVREEFSIRLARLLALQRVSDEACVAPRVQLDELGLPEVDRQRQTAQALNVASNPLPGGVGEAEPMPAEQLDMRAAVQAGSLLPKYQADLQGAHGATRQCAAMIARMQVLAGNILQPDATLEATRRAELVREAEAGAEVFS